MNHKSPPPLVTVIIACYNHEDYIEASIKSVLQQTYSNIELIVLDDGSGDKSVEIIQRLSAKHGFFFEAQSNMGLSATLNKALKLARGKYFVPFGSDDVMMLDRIEKQVSYMEVHEKAGICGGNILKINENGTILKKQKINPKTELDFYDIFLDRKPCAPAPTLFFRKSALEEADGFDPTIRLEDLYIQLSITHKGYQLGFLNDVLAYYRVHPANTYKNLAFMYDNVLKTYERFSQDQHYPKVRAKFLNSMLVKASKIDRAYGWKILREIPLKHYNSKTARGLLRLLFS